MRRSIVAGGLSFLILLTCTERDIHPSDPGYEALADIVWDASDYGRLLGEG